jgi:hypothetical protein
MSLLDQSRVRTRDSGIGCGGGEPKFRAAQQDFSAIPGFEFALSPL